MSGIGANIIIEKDNKPDKTITVGSGPLVSNLPPTYQQSKSQTQNQNQNQNQNHNEEKTKKVSDVSAITSVSNSPLKYTTTSPIKSNSNSNSNSTKRKKKILPLSSTSYEDPKKDSDNDSDKSNTGLDMLVNSEKVKRKSEKENEKEKEKDSDSEKDNNLDILSSRANSYNPNYSNSPNLYSHKNYSLTKSNSENKNRSENRSKNRSISSSDSDEISEEDEKAFLLKLMDNLKRRGYVSKREYTMNSRLKDVKKEYNRLLKERNLENSVKFQRNCLFLFCNTVEVFNSTYDPFGANLNGWSDQVFDNLDSYDPIFERLYEKYSKKMQMAPELQLFLSLSGSAATYAISNKLFNKRNMDILNNSNTNTNTSILKQAANMIGEQHNIPPVREDINPPSVNQDNIPKDGFGRDFLPQNHHHHQQSPQRQRQSQQQRRPPVQQNEMNGPSDIDINSVLEKMKNSNINNSDSGSVSNSPTKSLSSNSTKSSSSKQPLKNVTIPSRGGNARGRGGRRGRGRGGANSKTISI